MIQQRVTDLLNLPALIRDTRSELSSTRPVDEGAGSHEHRDQFCTFYVDGLFFGVEVQKVQEVIRYQEMTRVPLAPPVIRGLHQSARADRHGHRPAAAAGPGPSTARRQAR